MKRNHLLLKDDVGQAKPTVRKLPPREFTYGKPEIRDLEGVGDGKFIVANLSPLTPKTIIIARC